MYNKLPLNPKYHNLSMVLRRLDYNRYGRPLVSSKTRLHIVRANRVQEIDGDEITRGFVISNRASNPKHNDGLVFAYKNRKLRKVHLKRVSNQMIVMTVSHIPYQFLHDVDVTPRRCGWMTIQEWVRLRKDFK